MPTLSIPPTRRGAHVALRVACSLLGGYVFVWGFASLGIAGLVACGVGFDTAQTALRLLAFLVFLVVFLWSFAAARLGQVGAVLLGGGAAMTAAAWALQRLVV